MIDIIVFSSIAFVLLFSIAWIIRPELRAWIEKPKYRFQANVQSYDQEKMAGAAEKKYGRKGEP
jgi:hypothetical protein